MYCYFLKQPGVLRKTHYPLHGLRPESRGGGFSAHEKREERVERSTVHFSLSTTKDIAT